MHQIPFGLRITPNLDFVFILKNHNPLRIKHASSHENCWRFSESLLLLQMWAGHNSHFILAEGASPGHPSFLWKEVISHSWSPFLIHSTKDSCPRTWELSLEDLLYGRHAPVLSNFSGPRVYICEMGTAYASTEGVVVIKCDGEMKHTWHIAHLPFSLE